MGDEKQGYLRDEYAVNICMW